MKNNIKNLKKGFYLVEIIIVAGIILILTIIMVNYYLKETTKNLNSEECKEYIKLVNVLDPGYLENNDYDIRFLNGDGCYFKYNRLESLKRLTYDDLLNLRERYDTKEKEEEKNQEKEEEKNQENLNNKFKNAEDISKTLPGTSDSSGSNLSE